MAHRSKISLIGLLILASSASAITVGPVKGRPVTGRPLEVNIPFTVDGPKDRACASASLRYGDALVPRMTLDVQGSGLKRNLLVTSRANVNEPTVTVNVRVGCGPKAVTRKFNMPANMSAAKSPPITATTFRHPTADLPPRPGPKQSLPMVTPSEPLFPPPAAAEVIAQETTALKVDISVVDELRKARTDAATAIAQLDATRRELAAVLDVERRTAQTLINADHQVRGAKSEVARMRLVLQWVGGGVALAAAVAIWLEFNRVTLRRRTPREEQPPQEPTILSGVELQT
jgi:hypothetical protein